MILLGAGGAALIVGFALGTATWALAAAALAWATALAVGGIRRVLLLLAAPLALTSGAPSGLEPVTIVGSLAMALLSLAPLVDELGLRKPPVVPLAAALAAAGVPVLFALTPPGRVIMASDLGLGAAIVLLGVGLLVASGFAARTKPS